MAPQQEKEKRNLQKKSAPGKHIHQGKRESLEKSPCIFHKHVCMHTHMQKRIHKNNFKRTHTHKHTHTHTRVCTQNTHTHTSQRENNHWHSRIYIIYTHQNKHTHTHTHTHTHLQH